jgi:hypothetical protein
VDAPATARVVLSMPQPGQSRLPRNIPPTKE